MLVLKRRNAKRPTAARTVVITAMSSLAWKMTGLISKLKLNGGVYWLIARSLVPVRSWIR